MYQALILLVILGITPEWLIAQPNDRPDWPVKIEKDGFTEILSHTGRFYISGQPDSLAFTWLKEQGVATVINLRTQREMDNRNYVPFDEKKLVEYLGMKYVHIPLGGSETPYSPEALEVFAGTVEKEKGKILLHCTVAWRASHMWVAYLIRYKNMPADLAIDFGKAINFGTLPVEGLLDKKILLNTD